MAPISIGAITSHSSAASSLHDSNHNRISNNAIIPAAAIPRPDPPQAYTKLFAQAGQIVISPDPFDASSKAKANFLMCYLFLLAFLVATTVVLPLHFAPPRKANKEKKGRALFVMFGAGVCMILGVILRMVHAYNVEDIQIAIASSIFFELASTLLIALNLALLLRFIKAQQPRMGWNKWTKRGVDAYITTIALFFLVGMVSLIPPLQMLSPEAMRADLRMQRISTTYLALAALLPIPTLALLHALNHFRLFGPGDPIKHGHGPLFTRILLLATGSLLLTIRTIYLSLLTYFLRPRHQPAWYHSAASFYGLSILPVLAVMVLYCVGEVDARFWFPEEYTGPGKVVKAWPGQDLGDLESLGSSNGSSQGSLKYGLERLTSVEVEVKRIGGQGRLSVGSPPRRNGRY